MASDPAVSRLRLPPQRCLVMGILNVTPDSFSDGGRFFRPADALQRARQMLAEGADLIDIGGESARPGAGPVGEPEELDRVIPVIEALRRESNVPVSIDTSKPAVMRAAVTAGADFINDVFALRRDGALEAAVELGVPVCLMHMQGKPRTMQEAPVYGDVVAEVRRFLAQRIEACLTAGIARERLVIDPGFGFGKTLEHNLALLAGLGEIASLECPVLVGLSRKSMVGQLLGPPGADRVHGSVALAVIAFQKGARIVRAHDVQATVDALRVAARVAGVNSQPES